MTSNASARSEQISTNTQPDVEVKRAENPLNQKFDVVSATGYVSLGAALQLNRLHRAMQGINAISEILIASYVEDGHEDGQPLGGFLTGGLFAALQALSEMSVNDIHSMQAHNERNSEVEACNG
ncbi:hypothetical protein GCM10027093_21380 [Paraburkholderia jirisanensis]